MAEQPIRAVRFSRRKKVLFAALTFLLALVVIEASARILLTVLPNALNRQHQRLVHALGFPAMNESFIDDPVLFWRLKPNLTDHELEGRIGDSAPIRFAVSTDARGRRRTPGRRGSAPTAARTPASMNGLSTVLFAGDSCTFGFGVNDAEAFPARVQAKLPGVRCVNLGVPGYSAFQGRRQLASLAEPVELEVLVVTFGFNDEARWGAMGDYDHAERLARYDPWRPAVMSVARRGIRSLMSLSGRGDGTKRPRLTDEEYAEQIRAIIAWAREHGAEPILVARPQAVQMDQPGRFPKQDVLRRIAVVQRTAYLDGVELFRRHGGRELFLDAVHANGAGNERVALALAPLVRRALREW